MKLHCSKGEGRGDGRRRKYGRGARVVGTHCQSATWCPIVYLWGAYASGVLVSYLHFKISTIIVAILRRTGSRKGRDEGEGGR